jgi:hypothetical protein
MTKLGDLHGLFMDWRFVDFFMDLRPPGRFGGFPRFGFNHRAPHTMFGTIPPERADLRLCQRFHRTFHGNFHGRLDFGFSHGRDVVMRRLGRLGYLAFRLRDNRNLFCGFRDLPDLGAPGRGNGLRFP